MAVKRRVSPKTPVADPQKTRLAEVQALAKVLRQNDLTEVEVETKDARIRVSRALGGAVQAVGIAPAPVAAHALPGDAAAPPPAAKAEGHVITSPFVGTFYEAPSPGAPPFVRVGQRVSRGHTLCIVEAMKLMNEIESETDCTILDVLVKNAEPVEYGQALFRISPA